MAPKKQNSKAVAALEKKAANEAVKKAKENELKEKLESEKWSRGSKDASNKELEEEKRREALAKKAERQALLEAEEAELAAKKPVLRGANKKAAQKSSGIDAAFSSLSVGGTDSYAASGIDAALDLIDAATKPLSSVNPDKVEKHPERRMKSAYAAFEEREMPILKTENPGLRLSQLKQMLQKKWKKSPENPMNQTHVSYDASKVEIKETLQAKKEETLSMYKQ